jgi:tripartite-type tricarboxylate transporter receptor subunit TctC
MTLGEKMKLYKYKLTIWCFSLIFGYFFSLTHPAYAQSFPNRPIHWIVPWPPGGGADVIARMVSTPVAESLGQPILIENKPGAGGNIGAQYAVHTAPDGYSIVFAYSGTHSINRHIYKDMPFEESDFVPIIFLTSVPQLLVVNPKLPVTSVKELIAYAKENPGKLTFGSSGNGAINHLAGQLFGSMAGIKLLHVPYKGGAPAAAAVLSGEVDILFGEPSTVLQFVNTGKLRALATSSDRRSVNLPDMPTIAEAGLPGYAVTSWNGILAPKATPEPIITRLNKEFNKVLADKEMQSRLIKTGYEPVGGPAENFSKHIAAETIKWGPIIKESGLKLN